jgi:hypothetical protein
MRERETAATRRADAAQRESDHQRWADDGGFTPDEVAAPPVRSPWTAVGVAAALGFAVGWLTGRRSPR